MRVRQSFPTVFCVLCGLALTVGNAIAETVADLNSFSGAAVTSSPNYPGFQGAPALVNNVAEGGSPFIFADGQPGYYVNISGLNGTSMSALRIFDDAWDARTPNTVSVYYSSANTTSLDPAAYTSWGTAYPVVTGNDYANVTSNPNELGQTGLPVHYADINAAIPAGTQSILLGFSAATVANGCAITEIQGIVGSNLLAGKPVAASSFYLNMAGFDPSHVTDGVAATFVFDDGDPSRSMAITGFDSNVDLIRIWRGGDRVPDTVTIGSTMVADSIDPGDYVELTTVSGLLGMFNSQGYADIAVSAPAGTKGLGFVWGQGDNSPGAQIVDIQAFATGSVVPEPSVVMLLVSGLVGLVAYAWRKRR